MERRAGQTKQEVAAGGGMPRAGGGVRPLEQIRQMQAQRVWQGKDLTIAKVVGELTKSVRRDATARSKAEGVVSQASDAQGGGLPTEIAALVRVGTLARGVLTLVARDASAKYRAAQWLRAGGEARLLAGGPIGPGGGKGGALVKRVRVVLEGDDAPPPRSAKKPAGGGKGGVA